MIDYELYPCKSCGQPSTSNFYESDGNKTYYCNRHFYARKSILDKEFQIQEFEMYKDKQWYQDLYPNKFLLKEDMLANLYHRKKKEQRQLNLFSL